MEDRDKRWKIERGKLWKVEGSSGRDRDRDRYREIGVRVTEN